MPSGASTLEFQSRARKTFRKRYKPLFASNS